MNSYAPALAPDHSESFNQVSDIVDTGFTFAFQPIVRMSDRRVLGHEALVRGLRGESAGQVIEAISTHNRYCFDQACRMRALQVAAANRIDGDLHLNCSHIQPHNLDLSLDTTSECAIENGVLPSRVVLEFDNLPMLGTPRQLNLTREQAHKRGFQVLADNIGSSEVGLKRLAVFRPDYAKLDRSLIRNIDSSQRRQAIVLGILATARALGIELIATGIENPAEFEWLRQAGVRLAQGYLFARPKLESAPPVRVAFEA
ncbi:MAG: EAL domain-containing protein [Wenzhouxiangellaceae bacterium]